MMLSRLPDPASAMLMIIVLVWSTALLSWALSRALSRMALMPDRPNARSSHTVITPRAGGVAVVGVWALAMLAVWFFALVAGTRLDDVLLFTGVALMAFAVGAVDDVVGLGAKVKLAGQITVATIFVFLFGGLGFAPIPFIGDVSLGVAGAAIAVLWIVGFMNVYNFMDGINGLVSICGNILLCALAVAIVIAGEFAWAVSALLLAVALAGFVPVNIVGGRIFLGDNGSQAVGFILAALAILASNSSDGRVNILFVPVAFAPFILDVAFTLAHRWRRGRRLTEAHREHLYQLLVRLGRSHVNVACIYLVLTAMSCAVAMAMLSLPAAWQWIVAALLVAAFIRPSMRVYEDAAAAGLFNETSAQAPDSAPEANTSLAARQRREKSKTPSTTGDEHGHLFAEDAGVSSRAAE